MKRVNALVFALLAGSAISSTPIANAADIQAPVSDWTGWHVGAGVGYGMINHELDFDFDIGDVSIIDAGLSGIGGEGGLATVEAGFDFDLGNGFLIGGLFDYTYSSISTDLNVDFFGKSLDYELEATHAISALVRGGRLVNDHTLMYSLVGWTRTWFNGDLDITGFPGASYEYETDGLTIGGGIESTIADNMTLKLEYRYTMNESVNIFDFDDDGASVSLDENANVQTARLVLSYRPGVYAAAFDGSEERWTGFHVGIGAGYGMLNHVLEADASPFASAEFSGIGGEGFLASAEIGADLLLSNRFVAGVQADYTYSWASTDLDVDVGGTSALDFELEATHSANVLARAGILSSPDVLWYGLAGWTHTWFNGDLDSIVGSTSYDFDLDGFTAGAGVEVLLTDNLGWKTEYRYTNYEDVNIFSGGGISLDALSNAQSVRSTLTWRF